MFVLEIWAGSDDGVITAEEYRDTNFPQSYRTVEQFTAPFPEDNPVYKAGLVWSMLRRGLWHVPMR